MHKSRKLVNYFIYPKYQFALIFSNMLVGIVCMFLVHYNVVKIFEKLHQFGVDSHYGPTHPYFDSIVKLKISVMTNLNWILLLSVVLSTLMSVYYSHKVVGPLHRLKLFFTDVANGSDKHTVNFRKGDFFSDLPVCINKAIARVKTEGEVEKKSLDVIP